MIEINVAKNPFFRNRLAVLSGAILLIILIIALGAPG
jgi:hypothetical protein